MDLHFLVQPFLAPAPLTLYTRGSYLLCFLLNFFLFYANELDEFSIRSWLAQRSFLLGVTAGAMF